MLLCVYIYIYRERERDNMYVDLLQREAAVGLLAGARLLAGPVLEALPAQLEEAPPPEEALGRRVYGDVREARGCVRDVALQQPAHQPPRGRRGGRGGLGGEPLLVPRQLRQREVLRRLSLLRSGRRRAARLGHHGAPLPAPEPPSAARAPPLPGALEP